MIVKTREDAMARPIYKLEHCELSTAFSSAPELRRPHACEDTLLLLVTSGELTLHHPLRAGTLRAGDVAAVAPGEAHWIEPQDAAFFALMATNSMVRYQMLAVNEAESFVDTREMTAEFMLHQYERMDVIHLDGGNLKRAEALCSLMMGEDESPSPGGGIIQRSLFTALLVLLCRRWKEQFGEALTSTSDKPGLISDVVHYISENYHHPISIETLASQCFISSDYFRKLFRQSMGESPLKYINRVRAEKAAGLLENGALSVTDVAALTGFNDINNFTRIFKGIYALTPSEYRKRHMDKL